MTVATSMTASLAVHLVPMKADLSVDQEADLAK